MALKFDVEIVAEQVEPPLEQFFGLLILPMHEGLRNFCADAATRRDQSLVIFYDQFLVDARILAVLPLDESERTQFREVLVAGLIFGQHELVVAHVLFALRPRKTLPVPVFHQIKLAPDDGFDVALVGLGHELESPEHIPVVGQRNALLTVGFGLVHHVGNVGRAVEQTVLGMAV